MLLWPDPKPTSQPQATQATSHTKPSTLWPDPKPTSHIFALAEMVRVGGLGDSISDLPVAGAAPEWYSEKAIAIGHYFVASGVYTVFGVTYPIIKETKFYRHIFEDLEDQGMGKWGFTPDPYEMAHMMIAHINKKRVALGVDKARERVLVDMADRRQLEVL